MTAVSESALLHRLSANGDHDAFAEIVRRHAGMVYGVSVRVLRDKADAADVTQETFFHLLRQAREVSGSLAGWLHTVATRKSVDLIRKAGTRRRTERAYAAAHSDKPEATWQQVSAHVDQALQELDDELRTVLVEHFFEGRTTTEIAGDHNISQATASRRINHGLALLLSSLKKCGLLGGVAALGALLAESTSYAVPVAVVRELSKMALVGSTAAAGAGAGSQAAASGILGGLGAKVAAAVVVTAVGVGSVVTYNRLSAPADESRPVVTENRSGKTPPRRSGSSRADRAGLTITNAPERSAPQTDLREAQQAGTDSEDFDEWFDRVFAEDKINMTGSEERTGSAMGAYRDIPIRGRAMAGSPPGEGEANLQEHGAAGGMLGGTYLPDGPPAEANEPLEDLPSDDR